MQTTTTMVMTVVAMFLFAACGVGNERPVSYDPTWGGPVGVSIDESAAHCGAAIGDAVERLASIGVAIDVAEQGAIRVYVDEAVRDRGNEGESVNHSVNGRYDRATVTVADCAHQTVLHELAHAVGIIGHSDDPRNVMYPVASPDALAFTEAQAARMIAATE